MSGSLAFLDAALLAGLASLVVPLLIHLISRRRARRVRFAPLELLLRSQRRTARSIRLRQLLLLAIRTLLLAAVAVAAARPVWREDTAQNAAAPLAVVVVVDTSASMRAVLDGTSLFVRARRAALEAVGAQPADVRVGAVACGEAPRDLAAADFDRRAVTSALSSLSPGYAYANLASCVAHAAGLALGVEGSGERRVLVFSDLAAHGFPSSGMRPSQGAGVVVEWSPVGSEATLPNHALTRVDVERASARGSDAIEVSFTARRFGGPPVEVTADLLVGGARTARVSLPFAGDAAMERSFHHALVAGAPAGAQQLSVVLGEDALAEDNVVDLPFTVPAPLPVLLVNGAPQAVPFRDEVFYLESALRDARGGTGRIALEVVGFDRVKAAQVAAARVVVLANVRRLEDDVAAALVQHVTLGGGLLISVGDQVDVEWYNGALGAVLPAPLRGTKGQALLDDASVAEVLGLTRFRTTHPIFQSLASRSESDLPGLGRVRTHTFMLLEPGGDVERDVLVRFTNDAPALVERVVGDGRVLLLATSVDRDWSDLAIRPGFLPLARQSILHLGGALEDGGPRILRVGEPRRIRLPRGVESVEVEPPGGTRQAFALEAGAREVMFHATDTPGLYRVWARAPGGEPRERPEERFTVVVHPDESDLTRAPPDLLERGAPQGSVSRTADSGDAGSTLWPWLLLGAVALFVLEVAVLRRSAGPL